MTEMQGCQVEPARSGDGIAIRAVRSFEHIEKRKAEKPVLEITGDRVLGEVQENPCYHKLQT